MIAGRLAGAFRNIGRDRIADEIVKTMTAAGYAVRENDPFTDKPVPGHWSPRNLALRQPDQAALAEDARAGD